MFELIAVACTFFMVYRIARLRAKVFSSTLVTLTSMGLFFDYFWGGNLTEEYAMPFIAISEYIFLDYLLNKHISWHRIAITGISMGVICLLRVNMAAVWIVFCAAIFFIKIFEKDWKQLGQFVLWFLIGFSVTVIPFIIWLAANGALQSCIEDYILFNILYSSAEGGTATLTGKWNVFFSFACSTVYLMAFIGIAYHLKKNPFLNITYAVYMIIGLVLVAMSGKTSVHYGMVLIPVVVYPLALIMEDVEKLTNQDIASVFKLLITVYLMTAVIIPKSIGTIKSIPAYYAGRNDDQFDETAKEICQIVSNLTSEDDAISVYGSWDFIYVKTHRKHATRYSYQFPISQVKPAIMDEYMEQLSDELPSVIVVRDYFKDENILEFLKQNGYKKVWPENIPEEEIGSFKSHYVFYRAQDDER